MQRIVCLVALACIGCGELDRPATGPTGSSTPTASQPVFAESTAAAYGDEVDAMVAAEDCVKQYLKYPHDAKFPWFGVSAAFNPKLSAWQVNGKVTARNAFGADLTSEWMAIVHLSDSNTWECYALEIDKKSVVFSDEFKAKIGEAAAKVRADKLLAEKQVKAEKNSVKAAAQEKEIEARRRTWRDRTGAFSVEAALVSRTPKKVTLRKDDGSTVDVPLEKLSDEDKQYLDSLLKRH